jgi:hypothetical protein
MDMLFVTSAVTPQVQEYRQAAGLGQAPQACQGWQGCRDKLFGGSSLPK